MTPIYFVSLIIRASAIAGVIYLATIRGLNSLMFKILFFSYIVLDLFSGYLESYFYKSVCHMSLPSYKTHKTQRQVLSQPSQYQPPQPSQVPTGPQTPTVLPQEHLNTLLSQLNAA